VGVLFGVFMDGGASLNNLSLANLTVDNITKTPFIPTFFITVACGIMSGFHGTQVTLISRTVTNEKEGKTTFFNMMLAEGFIAMVWAAGAMVLFNRGQAVNTSATLMIGLISREFLGTIGAIFAILGVIVLPITSGDTAFRGLRLMIAEQFHIDQTNKAKRIAVTLVIFIPAVFILVFAKLNPSGFNLLWKYFAWTNQTVAIFALAMVTIYLHINGKNYWLALLPGMFYTFIISSYILHAPIGFGLEARLGMDPNSYLLSYALAAVLTLLYGFGTLKIAKNDKERVLSTNLN
jgi:carbon starvation protein CstA